MMKAMVILPTLALAASSASYADWQVWTTTKTEHVLREDPAGTGTAVNLALARNETRSFQVLMRSDAPVAGITLEAGDLNGPGGAVIPARLARLFRQHQLYLDVPTARNDAFRPGWYPDALIPFEHPLTRQPLPEARFKAVPFDLPANETHGFWVDVFVPAEAPPGEYRGTYRLRAASGRTVEIPVTVTVWNFTLPDVPTMQTALGAPNERLRSYYAQREREGKEKAPTDWAAVDEQVAELLSRHRINATPAPGALVPQEQPDGSFRIPTEQINAFRQFVDRYHINAYQVPHPRSVVNDPIAQKDRLHAWLKAWDAAVAELNRPHVLFYTYLRDEPNDLEAYQYVQKWGTAVREAKSVVKVLVVEQTLTQNPEWGTLYGAVDIWCPLFPLHDPVTAAERQKLGEIIWCYTALCQRDPTPWWHIDYPLLNYRVPAWIAWRYRMRGILYWGGMSHWRGVEDVWTDPKTLDRRRDGRGYNYNGEGSLLYPGRAVGYEGVAESIRVKALRDGIQDYEYLAILERAGKAAEAEKIVLPLAESWFQWEKDPAAYDKARAELAALIMAGR